MRAAALWLSGAALAFFATAAAFLLLAELAAIPSERNLAPGPPSERSGPILKLDLDEDGLASLEPREGQSLGLTVKNGGDKALSDVSLILGVSSENTALSDPRYYRRKVERLPAGESIPVRFEFDLSSAEGASASAAAEPARRILEVRASTPEGISTVRTAILPP